MHFLQGTTHFLNPLNTKSNPICPLLALLGAHLILHVSGVRVKYESNGMKIKTFIVAIRHKDDRLNIILCKLSEGNYLMF